MLVILATQKAEMGKVAIQGQPRQKVCEITPQLIKAGLGGTCLSSQLHRSINRKIVIQASSGMRARPYLKNNECKKSWGHGSSDRAPA
jgi:hypothetical protein